MSNTLKFGNGQWGTKVGSALAYNDLDGNFKPLPFDFTRSTSATRINKDGLIEVVTNNKPRIDFKDDAKGALKLEPSRSNLITHSEDIESWATSGTITKTNNVHISPDGTQNAGTITSSASGFDRITQTISVSINSTYTASLFIKKEQTQTNYMGIGFIFTGGTTDVGYVIFDAINGVAVSADARIDVISEVKDFGDYWQLISTATDNGNNTSLQSNIYSTLSTNGTTTGAGISSPRTIWGIQLEQGSYATSYIPTQGSAVTRSAETANGAGDASTFNSQSGALFGEFKTDTDGGNFLISISEDNNNGGAVFIGADANEKIYTYYNSANHVSDINSYESLNKVCISWSSDGVKIYINGLSKNVLGSQALSTSNYNNIKLSRANTSLKFLGQIKDLRVYNTALTDIELEKLTSWVSFSDLANGQQYSII